MKRLRILEVAVLLAMAATAIFAQTIAPTIPQLTEKQKAAYWKALAQQQGEAKQHDTQAAFLQGEVTKAMQAMTEACGKDAVLQGSASGDPECVAKPAASEEKK